MAEPQLSTPPSSVPRSRQLSFTGAPVISVIVVPATDTVVPDTLAAAEPVRLYEPPFVAATVMDIIGISRRSGR